MKEKHIFDFLSKRIKNSNGEPEVYIYDNLPEEFRKIDVIEVKNGVYLYKI